MVVLFVFPHPDDESFGPAPIIARLVREGHAVHLLTLTRGEATRERERLGLSKAAMGKARAREMDAVAGVLGLASFTLLGLPDGELAGMDPRDVEAPIREAICRTRPDVVVTYAVHGNSGHPDHLAGHAAVKRAFVDARDAGEAPLRRLALFTLAPTDDPARMPHLKSTPWERIGVLMPAAPEDFEASRRALACYATYAAVVAAHDPLRQVADGVAFELFGEPAAPRRAHVLDALPGA